MRARKRQVADGERTVSNLGHIKKRYLRGQKNRVLQFKELLQLEVIFKCYIDIRNTVE